MPENSNIGGQLKVELYKHLTSESANYREKVPALWLQKFVLLGGVIAFLLTEYKNINEASSGYSVLMLVSAIIAIPAIAALLDAKILEYALHARIISEFIIKEFEQDEFMVKWEHALWGKDGNMLTLVRSGTTVVVTIVPTIIVALLSGIAIGITSRTLTFSLCVSISVSVIYLAATIVMCGRIWRKEVAEQSHANGDRDLADLAMESPPRDPGDA